MANRKSPRPQGHRKQRALRLVPPGSGGTPPTPPDGLAGTSVELWDLFWASDLARMVTPPDHYALQRWIEAVDDRDRIAEVVRAAPTVEGSRSQPVLNPLAKRLGTLEGQIEGFERQFGMTPKARADLGIATDTAALTAAQLNAMTDSGDGGDRPFVDSDFVDAGGEDDGR